MAKTYDNGRIRIYRKGRDGLTAADRASFERGTLSDVGIFYLLQKRGYPSGERQKVQSKVLENELTFVQPLSVNILDQAMSAPVCSC